MSDAAKAWEASESRPQTITSPGSADTKHAPVRWIQAAWPLLLITAVLAVPYHLRPENFVVDDGYFYVQIARNIVAGKGSTFNGWLPTNGYHPLWMLVCCGCAMLARGTESLIQTASLVQDVLLLISVGILVRLTGRARLLSVGMGCTLFWFMGEVLGIWRLLESYLAVALQLALLLLVVYPPRRARTAGWSVGVGLLLGATILTRLDLVFFVAVILGFVLLVDQSGFANRIRAALLSALAMCCLVVPYLAWNVKHFEHLVPVSGAIKSTFPHLHGVGHLTPDVYLVALATVANLLPAGGRQRNRLEQVALVSAIASAVYLLYALSFTAIWPWYLTTGTITVALAAVRLGEVVLARVRLPVPVQAAALAGIAGVLLLAAAVRSRTNLSMTRALVSHTLSLQSGAPEPRRKLAEQVRQYFPADTRLFVFDTPGSLAYYSGLSITPADGLVCDYDYSPELVRQGFAAYARQHGMQYIVVPQLADGQSYDWLETAGIRHGDSQFIRVYAPMKHQPAGQVVLRDDALVFTAPTVQPGFERQMPRVGVWRISGEPLERGALLP